jgi:hypothetical protein
MIEDVACALRIESDADVLARAVASAKALGVLTEGIVGNRAMDLLAQASPAPAGEVAIHAQRAPARLEADHAALLARLDAADDAAKLAAMKELCVLVRPEDGDRVFELLKDTKSDAIKKQACLFLGRVQHRPAVRELIDAMRDTQDAGLKANAHWSLQRITGQQLPRDVELWEQWWQTPGNGFASSSHR